ncbi:MAG: alpha-glucan family phosphorylase [Candidatus Brocadiae bacterium]|nr:alpha-glucan family phosphorylase [Candidatus Brocadiia bacterium]
MPNTLSDKLLFLASNLYWTWHPEIIGVFRDIDPELWTQVNFSPVAFLRALPADEVDRRSLRLNLESRINFAYHRLVEYLDSDRTWARFHGGPLNARPVAYFSAEFGIHESLPIYSGGLGALAGDHLKSASDLGVPIVGVGLLYHQGYFRQVLDANGWQHEEYGFMPIDDLPLSPALDPAGRPVEVSIDLAGGSLGARVWRARVGRATLLMLDSDIPGNSAADRGLTARLYGGDRRIRIRQEVILGFGGLRALRACGFDPGIFHLNEGHSAFVTLERMRERMELDGLSFEDAQREVALRTVFTTHTPVEAGHDRFAPDLAEEHLGWLTHRLGVSREQLLGLGRVHPGDHGEHFCMTVLALKLSRAANAVSAIHGHVSRRMWNRLFPGHTEREVPIGHITNGVHVGSWLSPSMTKVYERHVGERWAERLCHRDAWEGVAKISNLELWEAHLYEKHKLIEFVRHRLAEQEARRSPHDPSASARVARHLTRNALTIGFARRYATYKRATLLLHDIERLAKIVNHKDRPVQFVYAGKAHPQDEGGKRLIQQIVQLSRDPRFAGKVVFVEDYDLGVARHLVQGVDVWLNNPVKPLEACGTSGMKVMLNGGLNLSILDGWWAEGYDGSNGFAIGTVESHARPEVQEQRDSEELFRTLEEAVIPLYFRRNAEDVPEDWVRRMKNGITSMAWRFNSDRMVMDYVSLNYVPASGGQSARMP